jgi:hypothetical protein
VFVRAGAVAVSIVVAPVFFITLVRWTFLFVIAGAVDAPCTLTMSEINVSCCCLVGRVVLLHTSRAGAACHCCLPIQFGARARACYPRGTFYVCVKGGFPLVGRRPHRAQSARH